MRTPAQFVMLVLLGTGGLLPAQDAPAKIVQVVHTDKLDFPAGGRLVLKNSVGELTVQGWDQPGFEITTIKSTKDAYAAGDREKAVQELERVRISAARQGDDVVVTTEFPTHRILPQGSLLRPGTSFDLEYRITIPMNARLAVDHHTGEVHIDNLTSDIRVVVTNGEITLHLPRDGQNDIDARTRVGAVDSEFPGTNRARPWPFGHGLVKSAPSAPKLYLRVGAGDITILKIFR